MEVEAEYYPNRYYSSVPDQRGLFPFALEGMTPYVVGITCDFSEANEHFLPLWMEIIQAFPVYFCIEIRSKCDREEFEAMCEKFKLCYHYITERKKARYPVVIVEIQNVKQWKELAIYCNYLTSNELGTVMWSTKAEIFKVEKREWKETNVLSDAIVVNIEHDTTIFWVSYSNDYVVAISNESHFSTYENLIKTFPTFIVPTLIKFED